MKQRTKNLKISFKKLDSLIRLAKLTTFSQIDKEKKTKDAEL